MVSRWSLGEVCLGRRLLPEVQIKEALGFAPGAGGGVCVCEQRTSRIKVLAGKEVVLSQLAEG